MKFGIGIFAACLLVCVLFVTLAFAHDSWISNNQWRNTAGQWCCGTGDCGIVQDPENSVTTVPGGYHVNGRVQIDGTVPNGNVTFPVDANIPYNERLPSPDGKYWYCKGWDNTPRCFFAPTPTY